MKPKNHVRRTQFLLNLLLILRITNFL